MDISCQLPVLRQPVHGFIFERLVRVYISKHCWFQNHEPDVDQVSVRIGLFPERIDDAIFAYFDYALALREVVHGNRPYLPMPLMESDQFRNIDVGYAVPIGE